MRSTRRQKDALSGAGIPSMKQNAPILPISMMSFPRGGLEPEQSERLAEVSDLALVRAVEGRENLHHAIVGRGREQQRLVVLRHADRVRLDRQRDACRADILFDV